MIHRLYRTRTWDPRTESIWLTIYADMITNLVLVFLALYGLTVMGEDAISVAARSMKYSDIQKIVSRSDHLDLESVPMMLREKLHGVPDLFIQGEYNSVRIEFGENLLFPSGSASLKEESMSRLELIAQLLNTVPYTVVVEGHTDNIPIKKGGLFLNNRELSLARSMAVVRWMIDQGEMPPAQLAAAAYGELKPRSSNETSAGRRMNRRVEIVLKRDFPYEKLTSEKKAS